MLRDSLPNELTRLVTPRALRGYATGLHWEPVGEVTDAVAVYRHPNLSNRQIRIPTETFLDDYSHLVERAIGRIAEDENRPAREVLDHLLMPPADMLHLSESSDDSRDGSIPLDRAVQMVQGARRILLAQAHSVIVPQAYHLRLSRGEAEEFVARCRFGQTSLGSFVLNVACPLDKAVALPGTESDPFARRVVNLLLQSLEGLGRAVETGDIPRLLDLSHYPGMSANLCEALLFARPAGDRATLTISATWSRSMLPVSRERSRSVVLDREAFDLAEAIVPKLRTLPKDSVSQFVGYVKMLNGQPTLQDARPSGEVQLHISDDEEETFLRVRASLTATDYAKALVAHSASKPVGLNGVLRRLPRLSRIESITDFDIITLPPVGSTPAPDPAPQSAPS